MDHKIFLGKYRVSAGEIALSDAGPLAEETGTELRQNSVVYRADEIDSGRDVTLELIPAATLKSAVREQLEAETVAAKKLNHINIPALYDFGIEDDQLIYVTERLEGTTAEEWVNTHGPMPTGAVLRIALQVVSAIGAAATQKISHHAINPANLLLVPGQTPEGDWPLVKVFHFVGVAPNIAGADVAVASFDKLSHYASPEQLQHGKVDFRSEIYSLGATMWFLLTGAPPLIAPKGPLAMQPTTIGLAIDKLSGMPKRVRRLLAQMLSVDPEARPQDPLEFYRQIQDCLAQVDRRETMARKFGIPVLSSSRTVAGSGQRRFPAKALALAAVLLAIAVLAALTVPGYLRHQRIRQAEEPIGVPIGVTDAAAPAPAPPNNPVVNSNDNQTPPANSTAQNNPPAPPVVAAIEPSAAPVQSGPPTPALEKKIEEQPRVAANDSNNIPPPAPAPRTEATPPEVAAAPKPAELRDASTHQPPANSEEEKVASTIPVAKPISPEVRRAEPAPPEEGPESSVQNPAPSAEESSRSVARIEERRAETKSPAKMKRDSRRNAARRIPVAVDPGESDRPLRRLPRGQVRAHFIGVTPDGQWMFSLPSKKIVVVPPPPGG